MIEELYYRFKKSEKRITLREFQSDPGITDILKSIDELHYY